MVALTTEFGRFNVYDESNAHLLVNDSSTTHLRGYEGRNYDEHPFGSMPWSNFPLEIIPRSEWSERIKEGNAKKLFPLHHFRRAKVPILDQARTNYCWMNAVVGCVMSARARNGFPTVALSSASAAAPGKRYRNQGGWTGEAIKYIQKYGLAPDEMWPNAAIDQRYFQSTREEAAKYAVADWWELRPKNFDQVMTCLLNGYEVCVGLMWWGHAVYYSAPVEIARNAFGVVDVNSWGAGWENGGMSVLAESKATPDEANCITTVRMDGDR